GVTRVAIRNGTILASTTLRAEHVVDEVATLNGLPSRVRVVVTEERHSQVQGHRTRNVQVVLFGGTRRRSTVTRLGTAHAVLREKTRQVGETSNLIERRVSHISDRPSPHVNTGPAIRTRVSAHSSSPSPLVGVATNFRSW